jgi:hypothetical protein
MTMVSSGIETINVEDEKDDAKSLSGETVPPTEMARNAAVTEG